MDCQGLIVDYPALPLGAGSIHHLVTDQGAQSFDGTPSPGAMGWMTRTSNLSQRASSRSPSLSSLPSSSTQDFPPTPPSDSLHRLLQVPLVSSIRHRTPQACDKCRERKTKVSRAIAHKGCIDLESVQCSGHRPICVRCNNRGLACKYSTRETRIRASMKLLSSSPSENGRSIHQDYLDAYHFECGLPTPAHHSRMGYCQTRAFLGPGDYGQAVQTLPVKRTSPITERHNLEEDLFGWHQYPATLPDPSSDPVPVSFRRPVSDAAIITEDERTLQKPAHVRLPPTGRYHEIPNHIRDQMVRNPPVMDQEIGFNYSEYATIYLLFIRCR